ncbi:MAG: DNA recombination protein RmuC [Candidatus Nealsonbacteria bacterium]|nr:DNA recombination protein RmuC [Candidatus Nealsonbacteria bacterium]
MLDFFLILIFGIAVFAGMLVFLMRGSREGKSQADALRDLERRLTDLIIDNVSGTSKSLNEQVRSFTKEATQIREDLKRIQEKVRDVSTFQEIFKAPKLIGQWGEESLAHILSQHFPKELYEIQHLFSSGERVDAVLKLPDGKILPIDSKFSPENFKKMIEANSDGERLIFRKKFIEDIKFNIDSISSKYILPSEGTLDYALMYIPAEAIYSEIMAKETDLANYARQKKVTLASPNTFYSALRTIEHWFKSIQISRQTQEILKKLERLHQDSEKLMGDFRKLGSHLRNASSAYETSEKRLTLFEERVERLIEVREQPKSKNKSLK